MGVNNLWKKPAEWWVKCEMRNGWAG